MDCLWMPWNKGGGLMKFMGTWKTGLYEDRLFHKDQRIIIFLMIMRIFCLLLDINLTGMMIRNRPGGRILKQLVPKTPHTVDPNKMLWLFHFVC